MTALFRTDNGKVGFAELFFDLVFVFAITQVSHGLLHHYSLVGALETAFVFLTVWWVWIYTTWVLNRLDPEAVFVRLLLFALMIAGLFLSMALPQAFGDRGLIFAVAVVGIQLGRSLVVWAIVRDAVLRRTYTLITAWFAISAVFWIAGGLASGQARVALWCVALGLEYLGPIVGFYLPGLGRDQSGKWNVRGEHMAERCALFVIICLGETLLVSGATFADMAWDAVGMAAFLAAVISTLAMWWVYFNIGHKRGAHQIEHSSDPGQLARLAYTYAHLPIVAGVVLAAVGSERAIAHPLHHASLAEAASIIGGVALFLAGNGWFKAISRGAESRGAGHATANKKHGWIPLSHVVGLGLCGVAFLAAPLTNLLVLAGVGAAIVVLVAAWEAISLRPAAGHP